MANLEKDMRKFLFGYLRARYPNVATESELEAVMLAVYCPLGSRAKRGSTWYPPKEVKETLRSLCVAFREEGKAEQGWAMREEHA